MPGRLRQLVIILGDQLDADSAAFESFDPQKRVLDLLLESRIHRMIKKYATDAISNANSPTTTR